MEEGNCDVQVGEFEILNGTERWERKGTSNRVRKIHLPIRKSEKMFTKLIFFRQENSFREIKFLKKI